MRYYFTILIIFISFAINAQKIIEVPPGTIRINDSLFIDKGPVDNLMYSEFTDNVRALWTYTLQDSLELLELENMGHSLLTHSLNANQNKEIYAKVTVAQNLELPENVGIYSYFNHPEYKYHPVIGISKDLAQLFCQWRTDMVNLRWSAEVRNSNQKYDKIKYRLPTPAEYVLAIEYFTNKDKLLVDNKKSPLKIDLKELLYNDNFILFDIPEYTSKEQYFIEGSTKKVENRQDENYVLFRCICEVQN